MNWEGDYTERGTGTVISNPDYISSWEIVVRDGDNLEDVKLKGFISGK